MKRFSRGRMYFSETPEEAAAIVAGWASSLEAARLIYVGAVPAPTRLTDARASGIIEGEAGDARRKGQDDGK